MSCPARRFWEIVDAFDEIAPVYDRWRSTPFGALVDGWERDVILSLIQGRAGTRALDVGCGTGHVALELARRGTPVIGLDPSVGMLERARAQAQEAALPLALVRGCAEALPFRSESFALVTSVATLEFTSSPQEAVAEVWRSLQPGGCLVVGILNRGSLWARAWRGGVYAHARFFTLGELEGLLRPYGRARWKGAAFAPSWFAFLPLALARFVERLGRLFRWRWGAFIAACVVKGPP